MKMYIYYENNNRKDGTELKVYKSKYYYENLLNQLEKNNGKDENLSWQIKEELVADLLRNVDWIS